MLTVFVALVTPPTVGSFKKQSQYDNKSTTKPTEPKDVELRRCPQYILISSTELAEYTVRKVNDTLHGHAGRSVTKLFSPPSHASQGEDQSVPFRPKMDLSNLPGEASYELVVWYLADYLSLQPFI
jgi:hypothetical protein